MSMETAGFHNLPGRKQEDVLNFVVEFLRSDLSAMSVYFAHVFTVLPSLMRVG